MKTTKRKKTSTGAKVAAAAGLGLVVAGLVSALFKAVNAEKRAQLPPVALEDEEAAARFDGEGGSMQPVAVH